MGDRRTWTVRTAGPEAGLGPVGPFANPWSNVALTYFRVIVPPLTPRSTPASLLSFAEIQTSPRPENKQRERCTAANRTSVAFTRVPRSIRDRVSARIVRTENHGNEGEATILRQRPTARLILFNQLLQVYRSKKRTNRRRRRGTRRRQGRRRIRCSNKGPRCAEAAVSVR